ncbi:MAG: DUF3054 domain-containing protein [Actinomycetota bacterium]|nr:DUF3054 domain-containing protein [Actinomycetota bacterium]
MTTPTRRWPTRREPTASGSTANGDIEQSSVRRVTIALAFDVAAVAAFVVIGRRSHDDGLTVAGVARTAAPFLLALAIGWVLARGWRAPMAIRTGVVVWVTTVVAGLALRRVAFSDGTAVAFVIVTAVTLGLLLCGWRAVARSRPS